MQVGLITEGLCDQEVIRSILKGASGIHACDVIPLRPEQSTDRTDRCAPHHTMAPDEFSNNSLVRRECESREKIRDFFDYVDEERLVVVHVDSAEAADLGVEKPSKAPDDLEQYVNEVCRRMVYATVGWLAGEYIDRVLFAVAIEETEAWLLAHWEDAANDTSKYERPKERLIRLLNEDRCGMSKADRKRVLRANEQEQAEELSRPLRKWKVLDAATERSVSLRRFVEQLLKRED